LEVGGKPLPLVDNFFVMALLSLALNLLCFSGQYLVNTFNQELAPQERAKLFALESTREELKLAISEKRLWSTTWTQQFYILFIRGLKERRHEFLSWLRFVQCIAISLIVGCLWWRSKIQNEDQLSDQAGLVFFIAIFWGMFPLFTAIFTFPLERAMLAKERASDLYRLSAYFMARTLGDLPLDLVMPSLFLLIVYFMTNLHLSAAAFFFTTLTVFLDVVTSQVCSTTNILKQHFLIKHGYKIYIFASSNCNTCDCNAWYL
jgi:hypothetical protein